MDLKKLFTGGIVGGILFFGLGYLIFGMLLTGYMEKHPGTATNVMLPETEIRFLYLALGNLLSGFLMAYIFIRANVKNAMGGLITGGIVGFLMLASIDLVWYGTSNVMSKSSLLADVAGATVMSAIVGAVVGLVMNMGKKAA